jgi:protein TonB
VPPAQRPTSASSSKQFRSSEVNIRTAVETKHRFPSDPQVDAIIRQVIRTWRFKPFEVGSKPISVCTETTYTLTFE